MRILHVAASYLPATRYGGTIVSVHGLCRALATRGHDVHVFTTSVDGDGDCDVAHGVPTMIDGVSVWYFRSTYLRRLYYAPLLDAALRGQIRQFDVLHTHAIYLWPLWRAAARARAAGVPHVISPRGMLEKALIERKSPLWKSALIAFVERRNLEGAAAIHVTSRREREEAEAFGFNLPEVYEVPNGVDLSPPSAPPAAAIMAMSAHQPFALFLGRINWKKGLDRLIASMAAAPGWQLVVAGNDDEGYRSQLELQVAAAGVAGRVTFAGAVGAADKAALLRMARVLVLPSYSENFGNVVLEAMAASCAVVVTPEVGIADEVNRADAGWVVDGAPARLGARLAAIIDDPAACAAAGARGRQAVLARFTWERVSEQMETVYARVVSGSALMHRH